MNFKRLTAAALAAVITLTSAIQGYAMRSAAEETGTQPSVSGNDMNIEGTNSFGKMFASELSAKQAEQLENNGCNIFSVEMDGTTATVSYQTAVDCTLVIGIYDESGTTLYATGTAEVTPDERETTVTIETDEMPQYFYIKGYLADSFLLNPLCTVYECPNYTQEMQDFFAKTVDDFDEEKVINFDEDKTNNFAVYSESTIVIPENEGYNIVTSADDENDAYVIENADKNVLALQEGDIFAYEYGENELLIVKIGTIAVDGTTVTITGVETDMDEVFEFVRIETEGDLTDAEASANPEIVDTEEAAEVRTNAPSQMPLAKANDVESGIESSAELTFSFEGEYKKDSNKMQDTGKKDKDGKPIKRQVSALSSDAKINGSASLKVAFRTKVYSSWSYSYAEMELSYEGKLNLNASVNVNFTLDFETLTFKLLSGAVTVNLTPQLILKLQAEVDFNGRWWGSVGGRASLENKKISVENISKSPQHSIENKMDGSIYIGLNLEPQITIFHEKIASANMEGEIGIKLTQKRELSYDSTVDYSQEKKLHDCTWCYDGDIFLCGNFRFNIELFGHQSDDKYLIGSKDSDAEKKIADYYWSVDRGEFAMKECPHQFYRLQFSVYDTNQKPLEGVRIILTAFGDYIREISTDGVISSDSASSAIMTTSESGKAAAFINVSEPIIIGVHYTKDGYKPLTGISHKLTIDKNGVLNVDKQPVSDSLEVELEPKNAVQFSVTDEAGEPIEGVEITIGEDTQTTDADGNLLWTGLEPGEYSAAFHKDGLANHVEKLTLGEETLAVEVVMKKPVEIIGNRLSLGEDHSAYITEDGSLYTWGYNYYGRLGDGTTTNRSAPVKIMDNVASVSLGDYHSAAITTDGSLYTWGFNYYGQLGDGTTTNRSTPVKIMDNVVAVSLGSLRYSAAITTDGSLYTWGFNYYGQLGDGTTTDSSTPVKIMDNVASVSLGTKHSAAITTDGSLYTWGNNYSGQLGNGESGGSEYIYTKGIDSNIPIKIMDNVASVSLGEYHSAAITTDGSLYMWGNNMYYQLGNRYLYYMSAIPVKIMDNVASVSLGDFYSAAITTDGSLYTWGENSFRQLGDGTTKDRHTPVKIMDNVASVSLGEYHSAAITTDGSLYTWGYNYYGQLGDGTTKSKSVPTKIEIPTGNTATVSLNTSTPVTATSGETTSPQTSLTDLIPDTVYNYYILYSDAEDKLLTSANIQYITQFVSSSDGTAEIDTGETPITEDAVMLAVPAVMTADEPDSTLGDVNGDGTIDTSDAAAILVEIASLGAGSGASFTDAQLTAADINQSGALETSDAAAILSYIAALGAGNEDVKLEDFG